MREHSLHETGQRARIGAPGSVVKVRRGPADQRHEVHQRAELDVLYLVRQRQDRGDVVFGQGKADAAERLAELRGSQRDLFCRRFRRCRRICRRVCVSAWRPCRVPDDRTASARKPLGAGLLL